MVTMADRFREHEVEHPDRFAEILVVCPQCADVASIIPKPKPGSEENQRVTQRVSCGHCGYQAEETSQGYQSGSSRQPTDPYFGLPLWLQRPFGDNVFWAYNLDHLDFIEAFIRARLRERRQGEHGWSNSGMVSRFPKWLKAGGNREKLLAAIKKLRSLVTY